MLCWLLGRTDGRCWQLDRCAVLRYRGELSAVQCTPLCQCVPRRDDWKLLSAVAARPAQRAIFARRRGGRQMLDHAVLHCRESRLYCGMRCSAALSMATVDRCARNGQSHHQLRAVGRILQYSPAVQSCSTVLQHRRAGTRGHEALGQRIAAASSCTDGHAVWCRYSVWSSCGVVPLCLCRQRSGADVHLGALQPIAASYDVPHPAYVPHHASPSACRAHAPRPHTANASLFQGSQASMNRRVW